MCKKINLDGIKTSTIEIIGKFTLLWHEFIKCCFNDCEFNFNINESNCLYKKELIKIDVKYITELKEQAENRRNILHCDIKNYACPDGSNKNENIKKEMVNFFKDNKPTLIGALCLIYRIRNNLCHGLKQLSEINDQCQLFDGINNILSNIEINNEMECK